MVCVSNIQCDTHKGKKHAFNIQTRHVQIKLLYTLYEYFMNQQSLQGD